MILHVKRSVVEKPITNTIDSNHSDIRVGGVLFKKIVLERYKGVVQHTIKLFFQLIFWYIEIRNEDLLLRHKSLRSFFDKVELNFFNSLYILKSIMGLVQHKLDHESNLLPISWSERLLIRHTSLSSF